MKENLSYFRRNYVIVMLVIVGLSLLWHPISLVVLAVLMVPWIYFYFARSGPLVLFNRSFGENLVLAVLIVITIVAIAFTPHAGTPLLVSLLITLAAVLVHASFRNPNDSYPQPQDHASLLGKNSGSMGV
ncbi:hypothetical protein KP509_10G011000 [Ceratopteris richardii]|nr:hypothetical protein KP509_10G011000 [Ceratopteris richardii]